MHCSPKSDFKKTNSPTAVTTFSKPRRANQWKTTLVTKVSFLLAKSDMSESDILSDDVLQHLKKCNEKIGMSDFLVSTAVTSQPSPLPPSPLPPAARRILLPRKWMRAKAKFDIFTVSWLAGIVFKNCQPTYIPTNLPTTTYLPFYLLQRTPWWSTFDLWDIWSEWLGDMTWPPT